MVAALIAAPGCRPSPADVVTGAFAAAQSGDRDGFRAHLSNTSRAIFDGLASLPATAAFELPAGGPPAEVIAVDRLEAANAPRRRGGRTERVDRAIVRVRVGDEVLPVPLVLERDRWRIHLPDMEELWTAVRPN